MRLENLRRGLSLQHGLSETYIYKIWEGIIQRCTNPNNKAYKNYGGRGVKVHDPWRFGENGKGGFECFLAYVLAHLGGGPPGMTLDRYPDNDGNYEPRNIRWATRKEQIANQRRRGAKFTDRKGTLIVSEAPDTASFNSDMSDDTVALERFCDGVPGR